MNLLRGDFLIGNWTVHPSLNSLEQSGRVEHLEPKVMQVLLTLTSEPGEVFSREAIYSRVWPDVIVGEDVLIRAIGKIRRAFAPEPVIETVPKVGYRLIAPLARTPEPASTPSHHGQPQDPSGKDSSLQDPRIDGGTTPPAHPTHAFAPHPLDTFYSNSALPPIAESKLPRRRTLWLYLAFVILILLIGGIAVLAFSHHPQPQASLTYITRPLTTDPGSQIEGSFSPNGKSVAYVWRKPGQSTEQVYVMPIHADDPRPLSPEPSANQYTPSWSPSGRQIAFMERDGSHSAVMLAPARGGAARTVYTLPVNSAREYGGLAWSADGTSLIFPQENTLEGPSYLVELSLENGTIRSITDPPLLWDGDFYPEVSPDGRQLAFIRGSELLARDLYVMNLPNGPAHRITSHQLMTSFAWSADSHSLVFSASKDGTLSLWRVRATGGEPQQMPEVGVDAYAPAIARQGNQLIYSHGSAMWGIFTANLSASNPQAHTLQPHTIQTHIILTSSEETEAPEVSPNGHQIVYQSWSSGSREIWTANIDGSDPVQITNVPGESAGDPAWSPNGRWIAYDARLGPFAHIYVVSAKGGKSRAITRGSFNDVNPAWSNNGRELFFGSNRSGSWQIWKISLSKPHQLRQITTNGGLDGRIGPKGKYLYYTKNMVAGLWRLPLAGGKEQKIFHDPPAGASQLWTIAGENVYALSALGSHDELFSIHQTSERAQPVYALKYAPTVQFSIDPASQQLYYSGLIRASSHLTLVEETR